MLLLPDSISHLLNYRPTACPYREVCTTIGGTFFVVCCCYIHLTSVDSGPCHSYDLQNTFRYHGCCENT